MRHGMPSSAICASTSSTRCARERHAAALRLRPRLPPCCCRRRPVSPLPWCPHSGGRLEDHYPLTKRTHPVKHKVDVLVVGAGFSGAVTAQRLASHGLSVLVIDKRPHIGGNAYDTKDAHGILIHPYGPHIFHTNGAYIAEYLSQFTHWRAYEHRVLAKAGDQFVPIPINIDTVNRLYGLALTEETIGAFFDNVRERRERIVTSEDVVLNAVGRDLYEKFFRG